MKRMKKLVGLVLAMIMVIAMAIPVMADSNSSTYTLTIKNESTGHIYEAYQIFAGEVAQNNLNDVLSTPTWGSGVSDTATYAWIIDGIDTELTIYQALKNQTLNPDYYNHYLDDTKAADVVKTLSDFNTAAHAEVFAKIVGKYLTNTKKSSEYVNEVTPYYQITGLEDGYYLVKENSVPAVSGATHTDYILKIVKDVNVTPKDGVVTIDNKIIEGDTPTNACANYIGDKIKFKTSVTLPENYDEFDSYYQAIVTTLPEGLTLIPSEIKVYTLNGDSKIEIVNDSNEYYEVLLDTQINPLTYGSANFVVEFNDLKELTKSGSYTVHATTSIVLEYEATLNTNAQIGSGTDVGGNELKGNINTVYLRYDASPYDNVYGTTPSSEVYVFTFQLNIYKKDGKNTQTETDDAMLGGASFVLSRERSGHRQYAVLDNNNYISKWTNWINEQDLDQYIDTLGISDDEKLEKKAELISEYGYATHLESSANIPINVKGLDLDTYWLTETVTPVGYHKLDRDVQFSINASYDKAVGRVSVGGGEASNRLSITVGTEEKTGDTKTGIVETTVINNPGQTLPSTGGIGTTIFYVAGGALVLAAVVLLVTRKRMEK